MSLVLDLDETLVHCSVTPIPDPDVQFSVLFNEVSYDIFVKKRPHLDRFLAWASARFEITIFTASQQIYAEQLLNYIDPEGKMIHYKLYRDSCLLVQDNYLKDLNVLGRDLARTVLVDNSPHAFGYQVDNGVPIESWFDEKSDTELLKLMKFLAEIEHSPDVRQQVRQKFQVHKLVSDAGHRR
jgi:CTD small phosphatase-like protein 2